METTQIEKLKKQIQRSNAAFEKMTREERKVAIAKDVLLQLRKKTIVAEAGTYFTNDDVIQLLTEHSEELLDKDVSEILADVPECNVCAIGAAFVCAVKKLDNLKVKDLYSVKAGGYGDFNRNDMVKYLGSHGVEIFNGRELTLMEQEFEIYGRDRAFNFGIDDDEERLRRIMKAIIKADGVVMASTFPKATKNPKYDGNWMSTEPEYLAVKI